MLIQHTLSIFSVLGYHTYVYKYQPLPWEHLRCTLGSPFSLWCSYYIGGILSMTSINKIIMWHSMKGIQLGCMISNLLIFYNQVWPNISFTLPVHQHVFSTELQRTWSFSSSAINIVLPTFIIIMTQSWL